MYEWAGWPRWRTTLSCCWNRAIVWAGNQTLWGHRMTRNGGTGSSHLEMESFNPWCLVSGEFLYFYQRLIWPAHVSTAHQCMPGHQAAGSGSVLPPQFSHVPVFVGLGREFSPAAGSHGVVEVLTRETHEWRLQKATFSCFLGSVHPLTVACESQVLSCYYSFLTMKAVGSVHLFHKNKSGSGWTPNCIPL